MTTVFDCVDIVERRHRLATLYCRDTIEETGSQISITMLVHFDSDVKR